MPGQDPQTIKAVNVNGSFNFNSAANLIADCNRIFFNCRDQYKIESSASSLLRTTTGNANVEVNVDHLNLISGKSNSNASIFINASSTTGGIKLDSGVGGITQYSTGNIDINAFNSDINIGVFAQGSTSDQTNNVIIEANNNITTSSTDFQVVASDSIQLISLTGDISIGTAVGSSVIAIEDGNLLINQSTSALDTQLDIKITDSASNSPGYNGIIVNSTNNEVGPDITLQTSDSNASISMGVEPLSSKYSAFKEYIAMQTSTTIIPIYGPEFTTADIGRRIYWTTTDATDTIQSLGKTILSANNTYGTTTLTTSGTYTGSNSRIYRIEIDSTSSPNTFRWSRDAGKTYVENYRATSTSAITLEDGVQITFSATTGNNLNDYWTFHTKITAIVGTSRAIANSEKLHILQAFSGYIRTSNISDIQVSTAGNERMRITADGSVGIGNHIPTATLEVSNDVGKAVLVNEYDTNYQINPAVAKLRYGGHVIVWESKVQDGDDYGVYVQQMTADGKKFGSQMKVNITTAGHQSNPHISGRNTTNSRDFAVVWASEESDGSGVYDIYANIYINGTRLKTSDVLVNSANSTNKQLHPRIVGLTDGTYLIVWSSDDSNSGDYNVYGRIINNAGTLIGSRFQVSSTSDSYTVAYPYPFAISDEDATIPGGYGVVFMNEYESQDSIGTAINDDNRYNIQYRLFDSGGTALIDDTDITDSIGTRLTISDGLVKAVGLADGGFALAFYRNYEGKGSVYNTGDRVFGDTSSITSGTIDSISGSVLTVSGLTSTERYLVGETITIENFWKEKIYKVTHNGSGTAVITLSTGHNQISLFKYATSSTTPVLDNIQVNTSLLVADTERNNSSIDATRSDSIFTYKRPIASITELSGGSLAVSWTSGSIPSIYYQIINSTTGAKINDEKQVSTQYSALKQRNVDIAAMETLEGQDAGMSVVWDNETLDTDASGIYQTIINPNQPIFSVRNQDTNMTLSQYGDLGIGTSSPGGRLHVSTSATTSNVIIQNTSSNLASLATSSAIDNIIFKDSDNILGIVKSSHSSNYQKLNPYFDNLVAYYPFDEDIGSNALSDLSKNKFDGRIENFDIYTDWKTTNGKVNGCLEFNGSNNYISLGQQTDLHNLAASSNGYSINGWIKLPNYITTSANLDIICNGGTLATEGTYLTYISDLGSNGSAYLSSSLTTSSGLQISNGSGSGISLGDWHMITNIYHSSNTTLENYIDGTFNSSTILAGTITSTPTVDTYVGSRDTTSGFFRGDMDELRIYNTSLTREEISDLYTYGNEIKGKMTFAVQDGSNTWNDTTHGFTLDDTGSIQGLNIKAHDFKRIDGTTTTTSTGTSATGTLTSYRNDLHAGDIINVSGTELLITKVRDDTTLDVDRKSADTNTTTLIRKPSILSLFDVNDTLKGLIDYTGNMIIGSGKPNSMLELRGTGGSTDMPYITLTNTTEEDTNGGRETRLLFRGTNDSTQHNLAYIQGSHSGTGDDTKGQLQFYVNDGTSLVENIRVKYDGNVAIGSTDPLSKLHIDDLQDCEITLTSGSNAEEVYGETSKIYFTGRDTLNENPSGGLMSTSLSMIRGSSDSNNINVDGRIDFYTNNNVDNIGLQNRASILSNGYFGIGIQKPYTKFHATSEATTISGITATQSGTTVTLSENFTDDEVINGTIVFNNSTQTTRRIIARPSATTLTVSESGTIASAAVDIYYPGLTVDNNGNVAVGSVSSLSKFHVEGVQSTALSTKTASYAITYRDSTILGDASSDSITLTLPNTIGYSGLQYRIVRIDSSGYDVVVNTTGASTINGEASVSLSDQYKYVNVQSDGTNWYITGDNI